MGPTRLRSPVVSGLPASLLSERARPLLAENKHCRRAGALEHSGTALKQPRLVDFLERGAEEICGFRQPGVILGFPYLLRNNKWNFYEFVFSPWGNVIILSVNVYICNPKVANIYVLEYPPKQQSVTFQRYQSHECQELCLTFNFP